MVEELRKVFLMFLLQVYMWSVWLQALSAYGHWTIHKETASLHRTTLTLVVYPLTVLVCFWIPLCSVCSQTPPSVGSQCHIRILGAVLSSLVLFLCSVLFPGFLLVSVFWFPVFPAVSHLLSPPCSSHLSAVVIISGGLYLVYTSAFGHNASSTPLFADTSVRSIQINSLFSLCKPHSPAFLPVWSSLAMCNCGFCPIEDCIVRIFLVMFLRHTWRCN